MTRATAHADLIPAFAVGSVVVITGLPGLVLRLAG